MKESKAPSWEKTLSGVTAQVIALASSPRGDMKQLAELITRDPMLSARVLQTANSATYLTAGAAVTTIPDAIRKIGFTTVRNIASALGVFDSMPDALPDGFDPIRCWQHSFAVAQLCERIASSGQAEQSGLAYLVGLCHDLGDIFIRTQFNNEFKQLGGGDSAGDAPSASTYGRLVSMSVPQMIGVVLKAMGLPQVIREPIELFHSSMPSGASHPLTRILWMAENYANAAMLASSPRSEISPLSKAFCRTTAGDQDPARPDPKTLRSEVLGLTLTLARLSRAEEAKLMAPLFPGSTQMPLGGARPDDLRVRSAVAGAGIDVQDQRAKAHSQCP